METQIPQLNFKIIRAVMNYYRTAKKARAALKAGKVLFFYGDPSHPYPVAITCKP